MANILDILTRAQALRQETALNSITPDRAGGIMYDTLILINQMQLEGGSLLISKVYSSVAAMEADTTPTSDLTGRALRPGQLAVIVPSSSSSSDMGSVYRYNEPGSWTLCGKIGGLPMDTVPIQGSSNGITSGAVYNALSALRNEGYKYMGVATPGSGGTAPGTPNQPVFYVAAAGSYPNFGNLTVASGHLGFLKYSNGSWTVESIEVGKDYDEEISQLSQEVDDIESQLVVADSIPVAYEYIDNIYVSTSSIAKQNGRRLFYVPVVANTIVKASWSFTNAYVRCGFSTAIPANGVSVDKSVITVGGTGTGTKGATCSPSENGYFCVSFDDPSSIQSLAFFKPNSGIGKDVKKLQDDLLNLVAFDGYVEGNDGTSVTTTIPLPVGRYKMTIRDFVRGTDNRSYIIFRIQVGSRTICEYMGQQLVPDTFYFDVLSGETSAVILSRSVSGKSFGVRITASDKNGIFDYNPLDTEIERLMNAKKELLTSASPFVLLHFTDIHGNSENLTRVLQYYNTLRYRIDDIIHTGDAVANTVTATSFDFWDECGAEKVLNCIGNHDVWVTDDYTPPANFAYNIYFKPYIDNADWGAVVQPSDAEANGKCYYYKDYSNGIRLVVLDYREPAGQLAWFEQVLADAVTNELSVVAAVHYVPGWTTGYHNSFDISQFVNIVLNLSNALVNAVDTFIGNGGEFVCWLTGHTHRDNAGYYQGTNGKQVVINLDTASVRNDGNTRYRAYNSKSQDCFNIVSVNVGAKLLSIFRVGNDIDALQRHIGSMCVKYDTGELVWTN